MTAKVSWLGRKLSILRVARQLDRQVRQGNVLIAVPGWLRAEARQWVWQRHVEHQAARWAQREAEVPLSAWQAAARKAGEQL